MAPRGDRRSQRLLRPYRRIIYDARQSSSPVSNVELIEKYEEKRPGARERTLISTDFRKRFRELEKSPTELPAKLPAARVLLKHAFFQDA
jgi:hypothetical protein